MDRAGGVATPWSATGGGVVFAPLRAQLLQTKDHNHSYVRFFIISTIFSHNLGKNPENRAPTEA